MWNANFSSINGALRPVAFHWNKARKKKKLCADIVKKQRKHLSWIWLLPDYGNTPRKVLVNLLLAILRAPTPLGVRL